MFKRLLVLGFLAPLTACAGTTPGLNGTKAAAEECKMVDQESTDSHIRVKHECTAKGGDKPVGAPQ
jgi:hypothetical protein